MKKFFTNLFFSLMVFTSMYIAVVPLIYLNPMKGNLKLVRGGFGHLYSRLLEADSIHDIDILFLGSSHTYRGFDTELFNLNGVSSFNLGSSGQTPDVTYLLLKEYINKINPKRVIYEVYPKTIFNQSIGSRIDLISNTKPTYFGFLELSDIGMDEINSAILRFWNNIFSEDLIEKKVKGSDYYRPGGYVKNNSIRNNFNFDKECLSLELNNPGFLYFKKNLELIKSLGIEVILVFAPIPGDTYNRYYQMDRVDSIFDNQGLRYINYNSMSLNDTLHFKDDDHLNHDGVQLFNRNLMIDLGILNEKRL